MGACENNKFSRVLFFRAIYSMKFTRHCHTNLFSYIFYGNPTKNDNNVKKTGINLLYHYFYDYLKLCRVFGIINVYIYIYYLRLSHHELPHKYYHKTKYFTKICNFFHISPFQKFWNTKFIIIFMENVIIPLTHIGFFKFCWKNFKTIINRYKKSLLRCFVGPFIKDKISPACHT